MRYAGRKVSVGTDVVRAIEGHTSIRPARIELGRINWPATNPDGVTVWHGTPATAITVRTAQRTTVATPRGADHAELHGIGW